MAVQDARQVLSGDAKLPGGLGNCPPPAGRFGFDIGNVTGHGGNQN